jgi:hypothetical protein
MPALDQQVHGRHDPGIGRPEHRRIVADANELSLAHGQQGLHRRDETELAQIRDGNESLPARPLTGALAR